MDNAKKDAPTTIDDLPKGPVSENKADDDEKTSDDSAYFQVYSNFGVHERMLKDTVRTDTYRQAILHNKHLFRGKTVMDVGCGTAILSMFCAQAGARKVYAIDRSDTAEQAKRIVEINGMSDRIQVIRGKIEEIELPDVKQVDIIVSEWMGECLLHEAMLDSVVFARDKWLAPDGLMFPDKGTLYVTAIEDREAKEAKVDWWSSVYGFDMSPMKEGVLRQSVKECRAPEQVCCNIVKLKEFDIYSTTSADKVFSVPFQLRSIRDDYLTALVVYFSVEFTKCHKRTAISTGPNDSYTHWKHSVFYLERYLTMKKGELLEGVISCKPDDKDVRCLDFNVKLNFKGEIDEAKIEQRYKTKALSI